MSNDDLRRKTLGLVVKILVEYGFKKAGFPQARAAGMAVQWITSNYKTDVWYAFTDTVELITIINKSKIRMEEAREDYRMLQRKKARRIADKIIKKNRNK